MVEGANTDVGNVLNKAEVGTLTPAIDPLEMADGGIVPGAKTYVGNVLMSAAVGTLKSPAPLANKGPPSIRTPVVVEISNAYCGVLTLIPKRLFTKSKANAEF